MIHINLIPQHRIDKRQKRTRVRLWGIGGSAFAILALCGAMSFSAFWGQANREVTQKLAQAKKEVTRIHDETTALTPELMEAAIQLEASRAVAIQPDWSVLMALLGEIRGDNIVLSRCLLSPIIPIKKQTRSNSRPLLGRPSAVKQPTSNKRTRKPLHFKLIIQGVARTQSDVTRFVVQLENEKSIFNRVKLLGTEPKTVGDHSAIQFKLECSIGEKAETS